MTFYFFPKSPSLGPHPRTNAVPGVPYGLLGCWDSAWSQCAFWNVTPLGFDNFSPGWGPAQNLFPGPLYNRLY